MLELFVQRRAPIGEAILGELRILDASRTPIGMPRFCFTLERRSLLIAAGRYRVLYTVSDRAASGELWSPDAQHRLPLITGVPGRSGLRLHAANEYEELRGCVAGGQAINGARLVHSRAVMAPLILDVIAPAAAAGTDVWIILTDPLVTP